MDIPGSLQKRFVGYISRAGPSDVKVAVNDTVAPSGSVVVCVMSSGTVRLGPRFVHCSKTNGVEYPIRLPEESYAATLYSPA